MGLQPYEYDQEPDYRPEDEGAPYPYETFYGTGGRPRKNGRGGGHGGWWVLIILVLVVAGIVGLLSRYSFNIRQTDDGITVSIQDAATPAPETTTDETEAPNGGVQPLQPSVDATGSGTELTVTATPEDLPETPTADGHGLSLQEIYRKCIPSVVSITSTLTSGTATGTGIVMSADGYLITNEHVIDGAVAIDVLTSDDRSYTASLVGSDATSDLAVLKIDARDLTAAEFGDSDKIEVGDSVVAIGDPLGAELRGTMTDGIISAINRDLVVNGRSMTLLQTNAALNNGNSGGPLINAFGQVIGINTMKLSSYYSATATVEGLGFAIPIATAKPIVDELIEQGYVSGRPALGINTRELPDAVRIYYRIPDGVYVDSVDPASDAYAQGIRSGDTITAIEGVAVSNLDELNVVKNRFEAGDTVELSVYRGGELYSVRVRLMDASGV